MTILTRPYAEADRLALVRSGMHPVLARIYAARKIRSAAELETDPARLLSPNQLLHAPEAAKLLADAIEGRKRILIVADYDCDGATACAVGIRALRAFGAQVEYLVPNRCELGYGLSPELVDLAAKMQPDLIVTVDNGIASVDSTLFRFAYSSGFPPSTRSPVTNATSGRGSRAFTCATARSRKPCVSMRP